MRGFDDGRLFGSEFHNFLFDFIEKHGRQLFSFLPFMEVLSANVTPVIKTEDATTPGLEGSVNQ